MTTKETLLTLGVLFFLFNYTYGQHPFSCSTSESCTPPVNAIICNVLPCAPVTIDVLVVYTSAANIEMESGGGSGTAAKDTICNLIDELNEICSLSNVVHNFNLIHTQEISYVEGATVKADLENLVNYVPSVHEIFELRDCYGADVVSLIVKNGENEAMGVGKLSGCQSGFVESNAFSVINTKAAKRGIYTFAHEIGHNLGLYHNTEVYCDECPPGDEGENYMYCHFMRGYVSPKGNMGGGSPNEMFRTVMAYHENDTCWKCPDGCDRVPYWSNPTIMLPGTNLYLGNSESNSVKGINITACMVKDYRNLNGSTLEDENSLLELYNECGGASWNTSWDLSMPYTSWHGVTTFCGDRVRVLDLENNNVSGTLPDIKLQLLRNLNLSNNSLSGQMPNFSLLSSLVSLNLDNNNISGTIPDFSYINRLRTLSASNNDFTGILPHFSSCQILRSLVLNNNNFSGTIPEFNLLLLNTLSLSANSFSGNIPELKDCKSLKFLNLSLNNLAGTMPDFDLPLLEEFDVNNNTLEGSIPEFNALKKLKLFSAVNNNLSGEIPLFDNSPNLNEFYADGNNLSGEIPDFSTYNDIDIVSLQNNKFTFEDILPHYTAIQNATSVYNYYPQQKVGEELEVNIAVNGYYELCANVDNNVTTNVYEWYKDGVLFATTTVNAYTLEQISLDDEGVYHCEITNPNVPNLTLVSETTTVKVISDTAPDVIWKKTYGGNFTDIAHGICMANNNIDYIVCGQCSTANSNDYCIKKIDGEGEEIWEKIYGGSGSDKAFDILPSNDGQGYICIGHSNSNDGQVTNNYGGTDLWVIYINENGELQWQNNFGGSETEFVKSIVQTNSHDGYIILGQTTSDDFDINNYHDEMDYWAIKIDNWGNGKWSFAYGGSEDDFAEDIVPANEGDGYVVVGWSNSEDEQITNHIGGWDTWYLKLNENGLIEWQKSYNISIISDINGKVITQNINNDGYVIGGTGYQMVGVSGPGSAHPVVRCFFETNNTGSQINWFRYHYTYSGNDVYDITISNENDGYIFSGYQLPFGQVEKIGLYGNPLWSVNSGRSCNALVPNISGDGYIVGGSELISGNSDDWQVFQLDGLIALPVELISFEGTAYENNNVLSWQTAYEENTEKFIVERSPDGSNWKALGEIKPKLAEENNTYTYSDNQPLNRNYYRLKIVDFDQSIGYSQVIHLNRNNHVFRIVGLFPNPATDELHLQFSSHEDTEVRYSIYNIYGDIFYEKSDLATVGINEEKFFVSSLPSGLYIITAKLGYEEIQRRFVKY